MSTENTTTLPRKRGKKAKNDMIFLAALLLVVLMIGIGILLFRTEGDTVTVTVDGVLMAEYPLHEDRTVQIKTEHGVNLLVIRDGTAMVTSASCPDGICASHRPIQYDRQSIICLPNQVVIEIRAKGANAPDFVV